MNWLRFCLSYLAAMPLVFVGILWFTVDANAHVKWFSSHDVATPPLDLEIVISPLFVYLVGVSLLLLLIGCVVEKTSLGPPLLRAMDRVTSPVRDNMEAIFRVGCAFFFISIWALGGILLTPELKSGSISVAILHLIIAAGTLSRRTLPISGAGIVILFAIAIWNYGAFHLADYPVFLGVAGFLILTGLQRDLFGLRPIDVVRWTAAITLMWASVEKWAYPQWSHPVLLDHPNVSMGFDIDFVLLAAGAVEFALAFALIWTPLVRRVAAAILAGMFVAAVFEFGKLDMIGHTLIIVALAAIIADDNAEVSPAHSPWVVPVAYTAALAAFLFVYYGGHALMYGAGIA